MNVLLLGRYDQRVGGVEVNGRCSNARRRSNGWIDVCGWICQFGRSGMCNILLPCAGKNDQELVPC